MATLGTGPIITTTSGSFLATSTVLQNLPTPSGIIFGTLTQDYDQQRFFLGLEQNISGRQEITRPQSIAGLYDSLRGVVDELRQQREPELSLGTYIPLGTLEEDISKALGSWLFTFEPTPLQSPVQFRVLKYSPSEEILRFCSRQGTLRYLPLAIDLIQTCFSSIRELHMQPEEDPETGNKWLALEVKLVGDVGDILDSYDKYTDEWVGLVPWPDRANFRFSYEIA